MRTHHLVALAATLSLAAAACGSVEAGNAETAQSAPSTSAPDPGTSGPVTVTDGRGEELTLDAPATTVVGLEWGIVENLVSLGVMPVGVADPAGYGAWVGAAPLDDEVTDVGMRGEPSVDAIVALDPDLVVATTDLAPNVVDQLEAVVPVLIVRPAAAERPVEQMRDNLTLVAAAVGRTDEAGELLADLDTALADGAAALEAAGVAGDRFTLADGWVEGSNVSVRAFTDASLAGAVVEELGLESAWELEGDPDYGLATTDVEGLTGLGDVHFLYYTNEVEEDPFAALDGNAIWDSLGFVESGDVHRLPDGIWMFGGPRSVEQLVEAVVTTLTA